jgi:hypothetical protein
MAAIKDLIRPITDVVIPIMDTVMDTVAPITPILKFIAGVLQSKFAEEVAPSLVDEKYVDTIKPQLDRVEKAIDDLKMKGECHASHGQADHVKKSH